MSKPSIFHLRKEEFPQFNRKANGTIVMYKPEVEFLLDLIAVQVKKLQQHSFDLEIGAAFQHPEDQFSKAEGRQLAASRLKKVKFVVDSVAHRVDSLDITISGSDLSLDVSYRMKLRVYSDSRSIRVVCISMSEYTVLQ